MLDTCITVSTRRGVSSDLSFFAVTFCVGYVGRWFATNNCKVDGVNVYYYYYYISCGL